MQVDRNRFFDPGFRHVFFISLLLAAMLALSSANYLHAQFLVHPVNLSYLCRRADIIVQGQVLTVRHGNLPGYPNIPTVEVTLGIEEMLRGTGGKTYSFREVVIGLRPREGKQTYRIGQRLILFLSSPSRYGLSSPVGIGQGRFHIANDRSGKTMVVNERNNAELFENVEQSARRDGLQFTERQLQIAATKQGPVALDGFVSLVKNLTALPRIR
jgi:hypothetical protein